jgi:MYXO-CTERM domain-containing protein
MHGAKATLTTRLPALHIDADKATVALGTIDAHATTMATFAISLDKTLMAPTESDMVVTLESDDGCGPVQIPVIRKLNTDDKPSSSATDTFDASDTPWTLSHVKQSPTDDGELWFHVRATALDGLWLGADQSATSDVSLTSPPITAGPGALTIAFVHAFGFETQDPGGPTEARFDGGVIEISTDNGATWQDVLAFADPGYNGTLDSDPRGTNVLKGRRAFTFVNRSFPNGDTVRLNFATKLAGQTFRLRFRIGTDQAGGGPGWLIDNFQVSGASNTPFPTVVADGGACEPHNDGGCCQVGGMSTGNIILALGLLGLVLRRRRRHS